MNAVVLTVIALVFGAPIEVLDAFPTMDECLAAVEAVISMEDVITADCAWVEIEINNWRVIFGEKI